MKNYWNQNKCGIICWKSARIGIEMESHSDYDEERRCSDFACLPSELIRIIMEYFVKNISGLYFLRQLNKEWKYLAETSSLWNTIDLVFHCPRNLLTFYKKGISGSSVKIFFCAKYKLFETFHQSRGRIFRVRVHEDGDLQRAELYRRYFTSLDTTFDPTEFPHKVFKWFHGLNKTYQSFWKRQLQLLELSEWLSKNIQFYFNEKHPQVSEYFISFLFIFSFYGFYTLQTNLLHSGGMHWENHVSFVCIEVLCIFKVFLKIMQCIDSFLRVFSLKLFWNSFGSYPFINHYIILFYLQVFFLVILTHVTLTYPNGSLASFGWMSLSIPSWILMVVAFMFFYLHHKVIEDEMDRSDRFREGVMCAGGLFLMNCSITLLGVFLDGLYDVRYPIGYALIPVYPCLIYFIISYVTGIYMHFKDRVYTNLSSCTCRERWWRTLLIVLSIVCRVVIPAYIVILFCTSFDICNWSSICDGSAVPQVFQFVFIFFLVQLDFFIDRAFAKIIHDEINLEIDAIDSDV